MTHLVAGYPAREADRRVAEALAAGGASFLEVQFPYSDPTADGPAIQEACQVALDAGFRVDYGFSFVRDVAAAAGVPVFLMSYAGLVFARGVHRFVAEAAAAGVHAIIVPDLPLERDEGLVAAAGEAGVAVVPVTVATAAPERLEALRAFAPRYLYVALRAGTTGGETVVSEGSRRFLQHAGTVAEHVMGGFGISSREHVEAITPYCRTAVVGSAIVRRIRGAVQERTDPAASVQALVRELVYGG
jgi:tryptophan synthase alpha chain